MRALLVALGLLIGCDDAPAVVPDAGVDSSLDANTDPADSDTAGDASSDSGETDAGTDAGDSGADAAVDAGPTLPVEWDGTLPDEGVCSPDGFCTMNPVPTGLGLTDAWAAAPDDIWVVGEHGLLMHWDGSSFVGVNATGGDIESVHGCASDDVWAADSGEESNFVRVGPDEGTADGPRLLHWDGSRWTAMSIPSRIRALHCVAENDAWAVGDFGGVYRWDGATWTGGTSTEGVLSVFEHLAVLGNTVLAVAADRTLEYVDGAVSAHVNGLEVRDVTSDGSRILAATDEGVQEWASSTWSLEDSGDFGVDDAFAIEAASASSVLAVFGRPDGVVFGRFFNGSTWERAERPGSCGDEDDADVRKLLPLSDDEYWSFQWGEPSSFQYDCTYAINSDVSARDVGFTPQTSSSYNVRGLILADRDRWVGLASDASVFTRMTDGSDVPFATSPLMGTGTLRWADADTLWVTNALGTTARWESGTWTEYESDTVAGVAFSDFAYDADAERAWGVSEGSHSDGLYRWTEATGWERMLEDGVVRVEAEFGGVWIERADGTIEELVDDAWVARSHDEPLRLEASAGDRAWARIPGSPDYGRVFQWDGLEWQEVAFPTDDTTAAVGYHGDNLWVEGWRWIDGTWHRYATGMHNWVASVEIGHGQVWLLGGEGFTVRRNE